MTASDGKDVLQAEGAKGLVCTREDQLLSRMTCNTTSMKKCHGPSTANTAPSLLLVCVKLSVHDMGKMGLAEQK